MAQQMPATVIILNGIEYCADEYIHSDIAKDPKLALQHLRDITFHACALSEELATHGTFANGNDQHMVDLAYKAAWVAFHLVPDAARLAGDGPPITAA
jgi:hypothetical protein